MRRKDTVFTPSELKAFLWTMVISLVIAAIGLLLKEVWLSPSLGLYGMEYANSLPGVLDARPVQASF